MTTECVDQSLLGGDGPGVRTWVDGRGVSWAPRELPAQLNGPASELARRHDAVSLTRHGSRTAVHGGISGAVPVHVDLEGQGVRVSTRLDPLVRDRTTIAPDWDGVAHLLGVGAPLGGRTTVRGIRRLQPWETAEIDPTGEVRLAQQRWPWLDAHDGRGTLDQLAEALAAAVTEAFDHGPVAPLLSGGWDSRLLTALAVRARPDEPMLARTTSSDTGTVLEELVAARVAEHLAIDHRVLMPRRDQFGADLTDFAEAVAHQTSFHVWLVPVLRDLNVLRDLKGQDRATVLDGLGGGLVVGGTFSDRPGPRSLLERRIEVLTPYLRSAGTVLRPEAVAAVAARSRSAIEEGAGPLLDHPYGAALTAHLHRTVPGISLAPYGVLSLAGPVATPFLDDRVVRAAFALDPQEHRDGQLYRRLLQRIDPTLATDATAEQLTPWPRPHPRRITSPEATRVIRELVLAEPIRPLVSDELAAAGPRHWSRLLATRGPQHLLRGLAVLSLWFERHRSRLGGIDAGGLLR